MFLDFMSQIKTSVEELNDREINARERKSKRSKRKMDDEESSQEGASQETRPERVVGVEMRLKNRQNGSARQFVPSIRAR